MVLFQISIPAFSVTLIKKTKTALLVPNALIISTVTDRVSTAVQDHLCFVCGYCCGCYNLMHFSSKFTGTSQKANSVNRALYAEQLWKVRQRHGTYCVLTMLPPIQLTPIQNLSIKKRSGRLARCLSGQEC